VVSYECFVGGVWVRGVRGGVGGGLVVGGGGGFFGCGFGWGGLFGLLGRGGFWGLFLRFGAPVGGGVRGFAEGAFFDGLLWGGRGVFGSCLAAVFA